MAATTTKAKAEEAPMIGMVEEASGGQVARFNQVRLPYHEAFQERFGVDRGGWKVLIEAIWPSARTVDSVAMALAYCKARGLDPFKKVVHIVPMWSTEASAMVETVWPGIAELRTTAHRTTNYAGIDECKTGQTIERTFQGRTRGRSAQDLTKTISFPEWAQYTVYRKVDHERVAFVGPKVYWIEAFADVAGSGVPNEMWAERPYGQLDKCAEAAALRRAFPEELGNTYAAEEMEGRRTLDLSAAPAATPSVPVATPPPAIPPPAKPVEEAKKPEAGPETPPAAETPSTVNSAPPQAQPAVPPAKPVRKHTADHSRLLKDAMIERITSAKDAAALEKWRHQSLAQVEALTEEDKREVLDKWSDRALALAPDPNQG